jgi:hypothetical protein
MARFNANIEICNRLKEFFGKEENKELRFFQGLQALKLQNLQIGHMTSTMVILDNFHEESLVTLKKLNNQ